MASVEWKVVGASVPGFAHVAKDEVCEDFHTAYSPVDGWVVAVLSDGAGTARHSVEGARAICQGVASRVSAALRAAGDSLLDEGATRTCVEEAIESTRGELTKNTAGTSLGNFDATLIGVVAGPEGGMFFHIGDGAGCATKSTKLSEYVLSPPENGEYANWTYFFTLSDWREHLRMTRFGSEYDLIALMSDGVTPFALAPRFAGPHPPFFEPLTRYLMLHPCTEGERALAATLAKDSIRAITDDDKSLVWALRIVRD